MFQPKTEACQQILDLPEEGKYIIHMDGMSFLLCISSTVGDEGACKIWVQGQDAITIAGDKPTAPYNQLIFKARVMGESKIEVLSHIGYGGIRRGTEIYFLNRLLRDGVREWVEF